MAAVHRYTGRGRAFKAERTVWAQGEGWPLGPQQEKLRKEAMGRAEGIFPGIRPEAPLILSWSIPAPRCKPDYKQDYAQYSPGSAVTRLGMRTTVASVAAWGTKEGLCPALSCTFGQNLKLQFCGSII